MGDHFAAVWQSDHCPPTLKKMIFRTAIEEIIVRRDRDKKTLELIIHWKGGAHTQLAMERANPRPSRISLKAFVQYRINWTSNGLIHPF